MKMKKHNLMATALGTAFLTIACGGFANAQALNGASGVNMANTGKITNAPPTTNANSVTNTGTSWEFTAALQGFVVPASQLTGLTTAGGTVNYEDLLPIKANKLSVMVGAAGAAPTGVGTIIDSAGIETNGLDLIDTATSSAVPLTVTNGVLKVNGTAVASGVTLPTVALTSGSSSPGTTVGQMAYNTSASAIAIGPVVWDGLSWRQIPTTPAPASLEMLSIPAGTLTTLEGSTASIAISAFTMARTEITFGQYSAVRSWALSNGYTNIQTGSGGENRPAQTLNWYSAILFCNALSEINGFTPAYYIDTDSNGSYTAGTDTVMRSSSDAVVIDTGATGYRLPSNAEWEWAARGGNMTADIYPWGTTSITTNHANYGNNIGATVVVGSYAAGRNPYGLDDMTGNVWEWCFDWDAAGTRRLVRGGSYTSAGPTLSAVATTTPPSGGSTIGIRLVK